MRFGTRLINKVTGPYGVNHGPVPALVAAFKARVIADGGTFEAQACMTANIQSLVNINIYPVGDAAIIALRDRAILDSGTFEAYNCGIIAVQSLANIDLN